MTEDSLFNLLPHAVVFGTIAWWFLNTGRHRDTGDETARTTCSKHRAIMQSSDEVTDVDFKMLDDIRA